MSMFEAVSEISTRSAETWRYRNFINYRINKLIKLIATSLFMKVFYDE